MTTPARRVRLIPNGLTVVTTTLLLAAAAGGCHGGGDGASVSAFGRAVGWSDAQALLRDRMRVPVHPDDDQGSTPVVYRALWDRSPDAGPPLLVVIRETAGDPSGTEMPLVAIDEGGRVVRRGLVRAGQYDRPYCLVELRSGSDVLPPADRGRWVLGVALLGPEDDFTPGMPTRFHGGPPPRDANFNWVSVEPVEWADGERLNGGVGLLQRATDLEVRPAERAMRAATAPGRTER